MTGSMVSEMPKPLDILSLPDTHLTCPYKQSETYDCCFGTARGPVICNGSIGNIKEFCPRWARMADLADLMPELWTGEVCCASYRFLLLRCAEDTGHMAGAMDLLVYPNDGKHVWRNFVRLKMAYCPYCGAKQSERNAYGRPMEQADRPAAQDGTSHW